MAFDDAKLDEILSEDEASNDNDSPRDRIVMESDGTVDADSSKYVEGDDVMNSIAEGYF